MAPEDFVLYLLTALVNINSSLSLLTFTVAMVVVAIFTHALVTLRIARKARGAGFGDNP